MDFLRALVDVAVGIEIVVERAARMTTVHQLHAADLDDSVTQVWLEAGGFGVENDLAHGARVYSARPTLREPDNMASIASLASWSTRSLPSTPEWPRTQCHSRS